MENKIMELVFILDESGSMVDLRSETIEGVNKVLQERKEDTNGYTVYVSTVTFNTKSFVRHNRVNLSEVSLMTEEDYQPQGFTALLDAVGQAIKHIASVHKKASDEELPEQTLFVIMTDGIENASRQYDKATVKRMIEEKQALGWQFLFLGANIDVVKTATNMGIRPEMAHGWMYDRHGIGLAYSGVNRMIMECCGYTSDECLGELDADYQKRKNN